MAERLPQLDPDRREVALMSRAIKACMLATAASRGLDATICAAAFPSLAEMEELEPGIWRARVIAHEPRAPHQDLPQEQFNV